MVPWQLESIEISFDGGVTTLNFAEAAFIIQGSSVAYARKVEQLHSLLYRTLDELVTRRKNGSAEGKGGIDLAPMLVYQEQEFISLSHEIKGTSGGGIAAGVSRH